MKTPLRNVYSPAFFEQLCPALEACLSGFDSRTFIFRVFNNAWADMEFRERVNHLARVLHDFLPADFPSAAERVVTIVRELKPSDPAQGIENIFFAEYLKTYGHQFPAIAQKALAEVGAATGEHFTFAESQPADQAAMNPI